MEEKVGVREGEMERSKSGEGGGEGLVVAQLVGVGVRVVVRREGDEEGVRPVKLGVEERELVAERVNVEVSEEDGEGVGVWVCVPVLDPVGVPVLDPVGVPVLDPVGVLV